MKNRHLEKQVFNLRLFIAITLIIGLFILLFTRLAYLQVVNHQHYSELSAGNRIRIEPIPPNRGLITDRNGVVLAENIPTFELVIIPEETQDMEATLDQIQELIPFTQEQRERFYRQRKRYRSFEKIPVLHHLDEKSVASIAADMINLDGVQIQARLSRHYPLGPQTVHVVGYMGGLNDKDLNRIDQRAYAGTSYIGKTGIEQTLEEHLLGKVGYRQSLANAQGRLLEVIEEQTPESGLNIQLTLDAGLQTIATEALGNRRGAVVALNPQNGEILAMVSSPAYDGNGFSRGLSQAEFDQLLNNKDKPLLNRALSGQYPPGSTIKPMLGLAGLQLGKTHRTHSTYCPGFFKLPENERPYRDWKRQGHGRVNLFGAITESCDVYFYELALELGIDRMHDFLQQFMLGELIEPGIKGSKKGILPSREWKQSNFKNPADKVWFPGETVIAGIGQGYMLTSPLQLATATAITAMRGEFHQPHLLKRLGQDYQLDFSDESRHFKAVQAEPQHWDEVIGGMESVMHGLKGTARHVGLGLDFRMAGKSGTAQVYTLGEDEKYNADEIEERLRDHSLFIAYAPVEEPKIAVAVIIENGGGGSSVAAPVAKEVIVNHLQNLSSEQDTSTLLRTQTVPN
jgi:penicillin-binding protein 2